LTIILFSISIIYISTILWLFKGIVKKSSIKNSAQPFLSVIVAAHNEEGNIDDCLKSLIEQNYSNDNYEIIIINDRSVDKTQKLIGKWVEKHSNIKSIHIDTVPQNVFPKKNALNQGIEKSIGNILCFTDADCFADKNWLKSISQTFDNNTAMVIGLAPLLPATSVKTPFWQKLLVYESWFNGFLSIAAIKNRFPLTCTGRNLTYSKNDFNHVKGFSKIAHSLSGDDDLLMHLFDKDGKGKISTISEPNSVVNSNTVLNLSQLWQQKTRHISASKYYPIDKKLFFFIWQFCWFFITISPILAITLKWFPISFAFFVFLFKLIFDFIFHFIGFKRYQHLHLLKYFIIFQIIYPFYIILVGIAGVLKKPVWE